MSLLLLPFAIPTLMCSAPRSKNGEPRAVDILDLDAALHKLRHQGLDRECRIVELRSFGGLSSEEAAHHLGLSPATVRRAWTFARSWLHRGLR